MNDQTQELCDFVRASIEDYLKISDVLLIRSTCLTVAAELVARAARAAPVDSPGMPVVELILLSERIASLACSLGTENDVEE